MTHSFTDACFHHLTAQTHTHRHALHHHWASCCNVGTLFALKRVGISFFLFPPVFYYAEKTEEKCTHINTQKKHNKILILCHHYLSLASLLSCVDLNCCCLLFPWCWGWTVVVVASGLGFLLAENDSFWLWLYVQDFAILCGEFGKNRWHPGIIVYWSNSVT